MGGNVFVPCINGKDESLQKCRMSLLDDIRLQNLDLDSSSPKMHLKQTQFFFFATVMLFVLLSPLEVLCHHGGGGGGLLGGGGKHGGGGEGLGSMLVAGLIAKILGEHEHHHCDHGHHHHGHHHHMMHMMMHHG